MKISELAPIYRWNLVIRIDLDEKYIYHYKKMIINVQTHDIDKKSELERLKKY